MLYKSAIQIRTWRKIDTSTLYYDTRCTPKLFFYIQKTKATHHTVRINRKDIYQKRAFSGHRVLAPTRDASKDFVQAPPRTLRT